MACLRMRVVDGSVLRLIQQWLRAPVEELDENRRPRRKRNEQGTPQGGVICQRPPALPFGLPAAGYLAPLGSPLLANLYLHWFDHAFHAADGPARRLGAVLVRYADDFVVLARRVGPELSAFIEDKLEKWLGLRLNREKTSRKTLREPGAVLDFLGDSFRLDRDRYGRGLRYWNMHPSQAALLRERAKLRSLISQRQSHLPLAVLISQLNRHLRGWANYFRPGYSRAAMRAINSHVRLRLALHLRRRSQRSWRPPAGVSVHAHLEKLGLVTL
jgi:RNA-directed DNA polymerase